ncbi:MAG TPA: oligopeptide/dipeptide ABC transporter ATP-binding protein [Jatrophihabitans sp.]|nr:oligopeptide/dipeptide ABC transporter ATP-binding protein [Jatrophihabitans sp.]
MADRDRQRPASVHTVRLGSWFNLAAQPHTEALVAAVPTLVGTDPERIRLRGEVPSPTSPPAGCVFHPRCHRRLTDGSCETIEPALREIGPGKFLRCHLPVEQLARLEQTEVAQG